VFVETDNDLFEMEPFELFKKYIKGQLISSNEPTYCEDGKYYYRIFEQEYPSKSLATKAQELFFEMRLLIDSSDDQWIECYGDDDINVKEF